MFAIASWRWLPMVRAFSSRVPAWASAARTGLGVGGTANALAAAWAGAAGGAGVEEEAGWAGVAGGAFEVEDSAAGAAAGALGCKASR